MTTRQIRFTVAALMGVTLCMLPCAAQAQSAEARYTAAKERDDKVRAAIAATAPTAPTSARTAVITAARSVIAAYEALVRNYRSSGYADNALHNAATLADALHDRFGLTTDRDAALRFYKRLRAEYPTAPLAKQSGEAVARLEEIAAQNGPVVPAFALEASAPETSSTTPPGKAAAVKTASGAGSGAPAASNPAPRQAVPSGPARLVAIERSVMPDLVRVTIALDREVSYSEETLAGPARVFFDLRGVDAAPSLRDAVLRYPSDIVRQIRVGRHPNATRVVLDLEGVGRHSVYTLYNPFRLVVDAEPVGARAQSRPASAFGTPAGRTAPPATAAAAATGGSTPAPAAPVSPPLPPVSVAEPPVVASVVAEGAANAGDSRAPEPRTPASPAPAPVIPAGTTAAAAAPGAVLPSAPVVPRGNGTGGFSIARQLGLGVSRIVIDAGHGGHDPGAQVRGLNEADLTLDIALRLEKLLQKEPGLEVVLTRRKDMYIPLEERTAIANREGADLFLSIHANTSRNTRASGVETYFLSFAGSADAEAVAARENASSAGGMHKLPDIIKAITLNNKLDESRDFASMVQEALVTRLRRSNKTLTNRGVKKAPFVVLIGAEMPSVLAEVSFMTNKQDLQLLKSAAYKERIAEALHAAVMRYRRSLKGTAAAAAQ